MSALAWLEKPSTQPAAPVWNRSSSLGFGPGFRRAPYYGWGPATMPQFYGWATLQNASLPSICSTTESTSISDATSRAA